MTALAAKAAAGMPAAGGPAAGTIYAIGDIHGCYRLMMDLLERIVADVARSNAADDTTLVFLGDYIDRGPATSEVLAGLVWLERQSPLPTVFLKGNHEQVMLDYIDEPTRPQHWFRFGGRTTLRSYGLEVPDNLNSDSDHLELRDRIVDHLPASHLDFLRRLKLSHETEHFVFVHAGIQMGVPLHAQDARDLLWIREGFLEEQGAGERRIVHGHTWNGDKPEMLTHRVGVDTGAYKTGVLTAAKIQSDTVTFISTADPAR